MAFRRSPMPFLGINLVLSWRIGVNDVILFLDIRSLLSGMSKIIRQDVKSYRSDMGKKTVENSVFKLSPIVRYDDYSCLNRNLQASPAGSGFGASQRDGFIPMKKEVSV